MQIGEKDVERKSPEWRSRLTRAIEQLDSRTRLKSEIQDRKSRARFTSDWRTRLKSEIENLFFLRVLLKVKRRTKINISNNSEEKNQVTYFGEWNRDGTSAMNIEIEGWARAKNAHLRQMICMIYSQVDHLDLSQGQINPRCYWSTVWSRVIVHVAGWEAYDTHYLSKYLSRTCFLGWTCTMQILHSISQRAG